MRDGILEKYLRMFANLRTDKNRKRWSALTCFQAPHKPFVLLSVLDLIVQGQITKNFIEPSLELVEIFNLYWRRIMPVGTKGNMAYPFPRLKSDGFWYLVPNPGFEAKIDMDFSSMTRLRQVCAGARLDDELFELMMQPEPRQRLRMTLIDTYFAPEIRLALIEQGNINLGAYEYSKGLLFLQHGIWGGERLLPEGWVVYTTTPASLAPKGEYGTLFWLNAGPEQDPQNRKWPTISPLHLRLGML